MSIVVKPEDGEDFLSSFAKSISSEVRHGRVDIPESFGNGYVMGFLFGKQLRIVVRNYVLSEEVLINRDSEWLNGSMILISLNNILKSAFTIDKDVTRARPQLPSVTITTNGFKPELHLSQNQYFNAVHIGIDAEYLRELLGTGINNPILRNILANDQPLVFEQIVSVALSNIAKEIADAVIPLPFHHFFYKLKAQELLCYLLMELNRRKDGNIQALNAHDIKMLYAVKERVSIDLSRVPVLADLAGFAGISESKLKRLFKQVFGTNIYAYYQSLRMNEAAYLLGHKNMSVSEVGYAMGFNNLSHFTKVFEEYIGMKPKRFSLSHI